MASKAAKSANREADGSRSGKRGSGSAAVGSVVRRHRRDIWGLAAIVAGLIVAGSVWFSAAGPVGDQVDRALAAGFGLVRMALPVGLAVVGAAAIWGGRRSDAADRAGGDGPEDGPGIDSPPVEAPDSGARMVLGGVLLLVSSTGLLHLSSGRPGLGDGLDEFGAAGGALGVGIGGFLHAWTALWGSVLLLTFVGLVGVIVVTGLTVRSASAALVAVLRPAWRVLRSAVVNLFSDIKEAPAGPPPVGPYPSGQPDAAHRSLDDGSDAVDTGGESSTPLAAPDPFAESSPPALGAAGSTKAKGLPSGPQGSWQVVQVGAPGDRVACGHALAGD